MKVRRWLAALAVAWLTSAAAGHAAAGGDSVGGGAGGAAASAWEAAEGGIGVLRTAAGSLFAAPDPSEYWPARMPDRDRRFVALMDAVGYRLTAIETREGLFGRVRYRFERRRAPAAGDLGRARRGLAEHRSRYPGAVARAERRALRGLLSVAAVTDFRVAAVDVELRPWPRVGFRLTRRETLAQPGP